MEAREIIKRATSFGPDAVKAMGQALDEAWAEIAGNFSAEKSMVEGTRVRLANSILGAAGDGIKDVATLKRAAIESMRQHYLEA